MNNSMSRHNTKHVLMAVTTETSWLASGQQVMLIEYVFPHYAPNAQHLFNISNAPPCLFFFTDA